jgi:hypothetical protein
MTDLLLSDRREHLIDRLTTDYANGAFEVDELERRLALVHAAQTPAELDVIDGVPARTTALVVSQRMRVVMGSVEKTGPWAVPQRLSARVAWGHLLLDLRNARLADTGTTIEVNVTMGNVEVLVPPGLEVEVDASSFMGNVEDRTEPSPAGRRAVVRIVGRVKLGNLEVVTRRSGETARAARRRHRAERRAYRRWRRALPSWME